MSFRVLPDGSVACDTAEEAQALQQRLLSQPALPQRGRPVATAVLPQVPSNGTGVAHTNGTANGHAPVARDLAGFSRTLVEPGRQVLKTLSSHPDGLDTDTLAQAAGMTARRLGPVLRSLLTQAQRHGLSARELVQREKITVAGKPKTMYVIGAGVAEELAQLLA